MSDEPQPHNCDSEGHELCCYCWALRAKWKREYVDLPGEDHICDTCKEQTRYPESRDFPLMPR